MRGSRRRACSAAIVLALTGTLALAGCGGGAHSSSSTTSQSPTSPSPTSPSPTSPTPTSTAPGGRPAPHLTEVLAVPALGRFYGRCALSDHQWTLQFVATSVANDLVVYRIGSDPAHRANVAPRGVLTWHLTPGAFRSRQPSDPLTKSPAATVPTTLPVKLEISQGTEPHTFRVDAQIALAAAIGDTTNCALVSSRLSALTYFNGGP